MQYDNNGNPIEILVLDEEYDYMTFTYVTTEYTAEVIYDNAPNPYFYTLDAGGIIDVLDGVELNFSMNIQVPEIVQARMLLTVNNPKKITYKDSDGTIVYEITADYVYDADNYPTSATVTSESFEDNEITVYSAVYQYR